MEAIGLVLAVAGWFVGPVVGVLVFKRWETRREEQARRDVGLTAEARAVVDHIDDALAEIDAGFKRPPRDKPVISIDDRGRFQGWTSAPGLAGPQIELGGRSLQVGRARSRRRAKAIRRRLEQLSGPAMVTLAGTQAGRGGDDSVMITAMSASWSGRRLFKPGDDRGVLSDALTEGTSSEATRAEARKTLAKLRRLL